ncbi:MAG: hypothetical protein ACR2N3_13100 [Pyrinomonadaceae bacterium]
MIKIFENKIYRRILAILSFACFMLSLIIHLFSVFGINIIKNEFFYFYFQVLMFIPFGAMVGISQPQFELYKQTDENNYQKWFFLFIPKWIKYAVYVLGIYIILNFALCLPMISTVQAEVLNGKYVLLPIKSEVLPEKVIREISEQEYEWRKSYDTRAMSGFWMGFYLMPALFFWYERKKSNWSASPNVKNA